jgi:hypothetical protein
MPVGVRATSRSDRRGCGPRLRGHRLGSRRGRRRWVGGQAGVRRRVRRGRCDGVGRRLRRGCRRGRARRRRGHARRCRRGRPARRQEPERIDVTLLVRRDADAEVDVGHGHLGVAARADRADGIALVDGGAPRDEQRSEMRERDGIAVRGRDRDAQPRARNRARERDRSRRRCGDGRAAIAGDVDAAVLAGRVRMGRIERVLLNDVAGGGPRPGRGRGDEDESQGRKHGPRDEASHPDLPVGASSLSGKKTSRPR